MEKEAEQSRPGGGQGMMEEPRRAREHRASNKSSIQRQTNYSAAIWFRFLDNLWEESERHFTQGAICFCKTVSVNKSPSAVWTDVWTGAILNTASDIWGPVWCRRAVDVADDWEGSGWVLAMVAGRKSFSAGRFIFILWQIRIMLDNCLLVILQNLKEIKKPEAESDTATQAVLLLASGMMRLLPSQSKDKKEQERRIKYICGKFLSIRRSIDLLSTNFICKMKGNVAFLYWQVGIFNFRFEFLKPFKRF